MKATNPSRLALAFLDRLSSADEPLKGDLIEEFQVRRSQWWLWRQVVGAILRQPGLRAHRQHHEAPMVALGAALLVLVSFEIVLVANLLERLLVGPPLLRVAGSMYLWEKAGQALPAASDAVQSIGWTVAQPIAVGLSLPLGWIVDRAHEHHHRLSLGTCVAGVLVCAVLNLQAPFAVQFVTMIAFIAGLLGAGRVAAAARANPA